MKFRIDQIALFPAFSDRAISLLKRLGLTEWVEDQVKAQGEVFGYPSKNEATLNFNYQATGRDDGAPEKPLELEVLNYTEGTNWMDHDISVGEVASCGAISHLGMHVTEEELALFDEILTDELVDVAQKVTTYSHTNPAIKDSRRYRYVIYHTRPILGVDLKFIVRINF